MKKILGLDLGTNSIGWALIEHDFSKKTGKIIGVGSRIIPMSQDVLDKFGKGQSHSQTAERTSYRGTRRMYQRDNLRRERLHRVLNILGYLPNHYADAIDFEKYFGQFKKGFETKLNYRKNSEGKHEFIFMDSFNEMVKDFKEADQDIKIPYDWTLYYLRKKALSEAITKEELAWLILNFNQKRGYYQLRGEDDYYESTKLKEFHVLKVKEIIDTGDNVKGNTLYNVVFDNGWIYDKQIVKTEDWTGKTKEFIITTTIEKDGSLKKDKEGNIKRSYKVVDSEKDWPAIKASTEKDIDNFNKLKKTKGIGQYIYDSLLQNPTQKIRGKLVKTIERKYYKEELTAILKEQAKYHKEFTDINLCLSCIENLYPRNEAHKNNIKDKGLIYLFVEDIIFYQRPLKTKKSTISNCQYEYRSYLDDKGTSQKKYLKGISKSHPLYQEFRLWQFLKNLKIFQKEKIVSGQLKIEVDVTSELLQSENDWVALFDFLNHKKEVEQNQIVQYFISKNKIEKPDKNNYRWNYVEEKKYPCNETRAMFISRLMKLNDVEDPITFLEKITQLGKNETGPRLSIEIQLWHIIYSVKDYKAFKIALTTFADKYNLDKDAFQEIFKKFPPFKNNYGAYSEKSLKKLLPLMRRGHYWNESQIHPTVTERVTAIIERLKTIGFDKNKINENIADDDIPKQLLKSFIDFKDKNPLTGLNTYQACYAVYNRHSEASTITQWETPKDIDEYLQKFKQHSLRNPIVEQVVTETLRVVKDIWEYYGSKMEVPYTEVINENTGMPEKNFERLFDEIHIELGRDMKNPAGKREDISKRNVENENTNVRIRELLKELTREDSSVRPNSPGQQEILKIYEEGVFQNAPEIYKGVNEDEILKIRRNSSPTTNEIIRYKLWLEQGYVSPYTGKTISLSKLFTTNYQIEHIIPQSRFFDDSLSNKVICESAVNEEKDNATAYEFIKQRGGELIDLGNGNKVEIFKLDIYEDHCNKYFKKNRTKLKKLLSEDVPDGFIERQINDTRYISKLVKGLLSNIVRLEGEREATSKNIVPVTGSITSKLKQDWGLNEQWNKIIEPRFKRLNLLQDENENNGEFGYSDEVNGKRFFRILVPDNLKRGFSKKRIDHRHHALDALVIACTTKDHINYITSLNSERNNHSLVSKLRMVEKVEIINRKTGEIKTRKVAKAFLKPWNNFTVNTKEQLDRIVISFKQNLRIINKTKNKTWQWVKENGQWKKRMIPQVKGDHWAIRKPLHTPLPYGKVNVDFDVLKIVENFGKVNLIIDKSVKKQAKSVLSRYKNIGEAKKETNNQNKEYAKIYKILTDKQYLFEKLKHDKESDIESINIIEKEIDDLKNKLTSFSNLVITDKENKLITHVAYVTSIVKFRKRQSIAKLSKRGNAGINSTDQAISFINKISDRVLRIDLLEHLRISNYDIEIAFSTEGIEVFNSKRKAPVYKLPISESSEKKYSIGITSFTNHKYGESETGTNLYFAIYEGTNKADMEIRQYKTIPLYNAVERQKQGQSPAPDKYFDKDDFEYTLLFTLSPNDLVYVPTDEERENPALVNFSCLNKKQVDRVYKMVSCTGNECHFVANSYSKEIRKNENGANNKNERINRYFNQDDLLIDDKPVQVKSRCWKLNVDRLGNIKRQ